MDVFHPVPAVAEDTLRYVLHPPPPLADVASSTSLAACILALVPTLLPGLLWHRDPFHLKVVPDPDAPRAVDRHVLEGRMRVGDAIDDEWCAVWLLREISKRWDVVISASDSDGEFLLIEAAESLPHWVSPSNATNRVWLHSGRLHLIPLLHVSPSSKPRKHLRVLGTTNLGVEDHLSADGENHYIAIEDALHLVRDASVDTLAPKAVEDVVWHRILGYPAAARNHVHTTMAYLPVDIVRALIVDQSLVQKPVEAFYTRDAIQLRAAHKMARFPPRPNVLCSVRMTRTAYAQLLGQKFYPPKVFGRFEKEGTAPWRWQDVGMKLACGFEMLFQESKNRADIVKSTMEAHTSSAEARSDALRRSPDYKAYLSRLVNVAYFRDEVEGSQLWNELENKAAESYIEARRDDSSASRPPFAVLFNAALSRAPEMISDADFVQQEDSDEWMNVDAEDFDDALERTMRAGSSSVKTHVMETDGDVSEEGFVAMRQTDKLRDLAKKVERFVEGEGDVEGARFEDEAFSDEDGTDSDDEEVSCEEQFSDLDDEISDAETQKTTEAARQQAMDNLVPALLASEYGQMPASFNTQRVAKTTTLTDQIEVELPKASIRVGDTAVACPPARARTIRPPLLSRDQYEGVDSDDESSSDPLAGGDGDDNSESEEDRPQVVGEIEVDMNEEQAEFLEFSRQALGISDDMWEDIIKERQRRGAFVPDIMMTAEAAVMPKDTVKQLRPSTPDTPYKDPKLNSFEAVMQAMDIELSSMRQAAAVPETPSLMKKGKGKARATPTDVDDDMDIESAMQAELDSLLEQEDVGDMEGEILQSSTDYNLIKNLLESFKSQAGLPGPVSNLAGRLQTGWTLPRDES